MNKFLTVLFVILWAQAGFGQPSPDTLWTRTYGGSYYEYAYSVQHTTDGGYIVAGLTSSFGAGDYDFYLVKANGQGDTLWTRTYGGSGDDVAWSVQQTADGGYIVAGGTLSFGAGTPTYSNMYLVKTGPDDPWGLVITTSGGNVVLDWLQTGAASYDIYGATQPFIEGVLLDATSNTTWTDSNTSSRPSPYFYYVTAGE